MKTTALEKPDMVSVVSPGTSQMFLFSKTQAPCGTIPAVSDVSDFTAPEYSEEIFGAFSRVFPGVLVGHAFVDEAIKQMGPFGFGVLMIRSDFSTDAGAADAVDPLLLNVCFILEQLTRPLRAVWGLMKSDTLGCMIPENNLSACRNLAAKIQNNLSEIQKETVSIGISVYPLAGFGKTDAVLNALKALTHAAFVGSGSMVVLDAVSLNISGDQHYQAGHLPEAVEEYQKALQLDPSNVNVHNSLGVCYGMMGLLDAAQSEFEAALRLSPDDVMALYNQGVICMLTGRKEMALELLIKAAAFDDGIFELELLAGKLYLETGKPETARPFLEKALDCRPKSGTALRTLGACFSALNLHRDAVAVYTRAVRNNPNDAEALSRLGHLYDMIGENTEIARLFCKQSVAIDPENADYRQRLDRLLQK